MRGLSFVLAVAAAAALVGGGVHAASAPQQTAPASASAHADADGADAFDFQIGEWRVRHRVKRAGSGEWLEFDGTSSMRPLMDGSANVEDNTFYKPDGVTHGVALRTYDRKTRLWAIWWVDGRNPHATLDPPVVGRFENGVGTFYSDGMLDGKPLRTRFLWSQITATSARWEQAYSSDAGKTWDTNWTMQFQRVR